MQPEVKMFLDDAEKSVVLDIPESKRKIINPFYEATQLEQAGDRKQAERIYLELLNAVDVGSDTDPILIRIGVGSAVDLEGVLLRPRPSDGKTAPVGGAGRSGIRSRHEQG